MDVLLIDGGYLRASFRELDKKYNRSEIVEFVRNLSQSPDFCADKTIYCDCPQYRGRQQKPISGEIETFQASDKWLNDLAQENGFAVRRGQLKFRGWTLKNQTRLRPASLQDSDFRPVFEQKGVDMRLGLDIAEFCEMRSTHHIILVSGDTDLIPAMKKARKTGIKVGIIEFEEEPTGPLHDTLKMHADYCTMIKLA